MKIFKKNKKNIILTARDISAANALINFRKLLKEKYNIDVYCENPAYDYLKNKFKCIKFYNKKKELEVIFNKKIYAIISGYSSKVKKNFGVDEIFIKEGNLNKISTFVFQDYPGDFNFSLKSHPKYYLVVNELAKKITENKTKIKSINVGYVFLKKVTKNYIISLTNKKKILIAGQPINNLNYLKNYFNDLMVVFKSYKKEFNFFYRPHPAENNNFKIIKKIFNDNNILIKMTQKKNLYDDLFNTDLLISINSTVAIDFNYLKHILKKKSFAIYYINENKTKKIFKKINLYSKMNFAKEINSKKQLDKFICNFMKNKPNFSFQTNAFNKTNSNLQNFLKKISTIINSSGI